MGSPGVVCLFKFCSSEPTVESVVISFASCLYYSKLGLMRLAKSDYKLQHIWLSFRLFVCLSVCVKQSCSHWTDFHVEYDI